MKILTRLPLYLFINCLVFGYVEAGLANSKNQMKNPASSQVDLSPLATPGHGSEVWRDLGGKDITEHVDPTYTSAAQIEKAQREEGLYVGRMSEPPGQEGKIIAPSDIEHFMKDYQGYLKKEGLATVNSSLTSRNGKFDYEKILLHEQKKQLSSSKKNPPS